MQDWHKQQRFDFDISKQVNRQNVAQISFDEFIQNAELSVRATNVFLNNLRDIQELLEISSEEIANFRNCGKKTVNEILGFQRDIQREFDYHPPKRVGTQKIFTASLQDVKAYNYLFESILPLLSERTHNVLITREIKLLEQFMRLTENTLKHTRNCGKKTISEVQEYQNCIIRVLQKIEAYKEAQNLSSEYIPASSLVYTFFEDEILGSWAKSVDLYLDKSSFLSCSRV